MGGHMRTRAATTLAALLLAALTACSSGDDSAAPASDSSPADAEQTTAVPPEHEADDLKAAVQVYTAAYFAADVDTAWGMLSERCKGELNRIVYEEQLKAAKADYGPDHPATDVKVEVSGELARVTYGVKGLPMLDQTKQPWALERDAWKYDAC